MVEGLDLKTATAEHDTRLPFWHSETVMRGLWSLGVLVRFAIRHPKQLLTQLYLLDPLDEDTRMTNRRPPFDVEVPSVHLGELFPPPNNFYNIKVSPRFEDGTLPNNDLTALLMIAQSFNVRRIFEIGTFRGTTTLNLAQNNPQAEIFTLDLLAASIDSTHHKITGPDRKYILKEKSETHFAGKATNITPLYGDSATFDYQPYQRNINLVFVDGCHNYEYAKNDSTRAFDMLRPGGTIVWHDYGGWAGVTRYLNELQHIRPIKRIVGTSLCVYNDHWNHHPR